MDDRRLIEDYLPLEEINAIASREKLKLHPRRYVELIHYWPARRLITASRSAICAALVPTPRTEAEHKEAASFVTRFDAYESDPGVVREVREHVWRAHGGRVPEVLDLFVSGRTILLKAARFDRESHTLDYNPVAGVRRIEVKGRKRGQPIRLTTNEWFKARQLGDTYWLYVVWDPLDDPGPVPLMIRNPAKHLDYAKREVVAAQYYDLPADAVERAAHTQREEER